MKLKHIVVSVRLAFASQAPAVGPAITQVLIVYPRWSRGTKQCF